MEEHFITILTIVLPAIIALWGLKQEKKLKREELQIETLKANDEVSTRFRENILDWSDRLQKENEQLRLRIQELENTVDELSKRLERYLNE